MRGSETVTEEEKKSHKTSWFVCCAEGLVVWCKVPQSCAVCLCSSAPVLYFSLKKKKKKPFKIPSLTVSMKILNKIWETRVQMVCKEQCPQNQQTQVWRSQGVNNEKGMKSTVFLLCLQL